MLFLHSDEPHRKHRASFQYCYCKKQKKKEMEVRVCFRAQVGGVHPFSYFSSELSRHICLLLVRAGGDQLQDIGHPGRGV